MDPTAAKRPRKLVHETLCPGNCGENHAAQTKQCKTCGWVYKCKSCKTSIGRPLNSCPATCPNEKCGLSPIEPTKRQARPGNAPRPDAGTAPARGLPDAGQEHAVPPAANQGQTGAGPPVEDVGLVERVKTWFRMEDAQQEDPDTETKANAKEKGV